MPARAGEILGWLGRLTTFVDLTVSSSLPSPAPASLKSRQTTTRREDSTPSAGPPTMTTTTTAARKTTTPRKPMSQYEAHQTRQRSIPSETSSTLQRTSGPQISTRPSAKRIYPTPNSRPSLVCREQSGTRFPSGSEFERRKRRGCFECKTFITPSSLAPC